MKRAFTAPPSSLPTKSQFFRLCGAPHNRKNYLFVGDVASGKSLNASPEVALNPSFHERFLAIATRDGDRMANQNLDVGPVGR